MKVKGRPRSDGCKGIRDTTAMVYLVECAHYVARLFEGTDVHPIGVTEAPGRPVELLAIRREGGTEATARAGRDWLRDTLADPMDAPTMAMDPSELVGCEHVMAGRAAAPVPADALVGTVRKTVAYHEAMGSGPFSQGNAEGGLSTIEEKSVGASAGSGCSRIDRIVATCIQPRHGGLHLLDMVPDGAPCFGITNMNEHIEIAPLAPACPPNADAA